MFSETLKQQQPVVYQTLFNALNKKQLSHCYLFVGQKGTYKKQTAYLLAQSLICQDANPFACEQCASCLRVKDNNYVDLIYIDGTNTTIKNDDVANLQQQFEKTALEKAGVKVFIIDGAENLTIKAANSLLKFIEEPTGSITGIFITSQPERVISTIVSRCQTINFKPLSKDAFYQKGLQVNLSTIDAHLISYFVSNQDEVEQFVGNKAYDLAVNYAFEFLQQFFANKKMAGFYLQDTFSKLNKSSDNKIMREVYKDFLQIITIFLQDYFDQYQSDDQTYNGLLTKAKEKQINYSNFLRVIIECRDYLNKSANCLLLIDKMIYQLWEV